MIKIEASHYKGEKKDLLQNRKLALEKLKYHTSNNIKCNTDCMTDLSRLLK
jgi:hypothetical protein